MRLANSLIRPIARQHQGEQDADATTSTSANHDNKSDAFATFSLETAENGQTIGKVARLRQGAQSAMNHLIYGKWRKLAHRMPRLDGHVENSENSLIWLLSKSYPLGVRERTCAEAAMDEEEDADEEDAFCVSEEFLEDFRSRIWFSYREHFPPLHGTKESGNSSLSTTTDCGWGCMLRSAQMLLAQAFVQLRFGRDHRLSFPIPLENGERSQFNAIIRLFEDCPHSPLGLHALLEMARSKDWAPTIGGRWFSPSEAAVLLRDALLVGFDEAHQKISGQLCLSICADNCVVLSELRKISCEWKVPLLLVVPLRLGTEQINQIYFEHIQTLFRLPSFMGIIGGRPKYATFLVGCMDKILFALDPHVVQSYRPLDCANASEEEEQHKWSSFHCQYPSIIDIRDLDPSCAIGFLLRDEEELQSWMHQMAKEGLVELHCAEQSVVQPNALFTVLEEQFEFEEPPDNSQKRPPNDANGKNGQQTSLNCAENIAEFEFL